jgi:hypothetical protein
MDVMNFLKMAPAVLGIAGLLTYFMRLREPVSDHDVLKYLAKRVGRPSAVYIRGFNRAECGSSSGRRHPITIPLYRVRIQFSLSDIRLMVMSAAVSNGRRGT